MQSYNDISILVVEAVELIQDAMAETVGYVVGG